MATVKGKSTTLGYCATVNGSYTSLADIIDVTPPAVTVAKIDTTHLGSAAKTAEPGWVSAGEATCRIHFVAADQITNRALVGVEKFWKVTYSDGSTDVFKGYIKSFGAATERAGIVTTSIVVKVNGKVTFTAAA